jgi:hypothetical protein
MGIKDGIIERRPQGATHSFRLTPSAYSILEGVPKKSKNTRGRSAWVSEAICFYGTSTTVKVASQMGNLIFPNMEVASPERLHEELIKTQARVEFWVKRSDAFQAEVEQLKRKRPFQWITGILRRKKTPK